jgi:hypothetical protein
MGKFKLASNRVASPPSRLSPFRALKDGSILNCGMHDTTLGMAHHSFKNHRCATIARSRPVIRHS